MFMCVIFIESKPGRDGLVKKDNGVWMEKEILLCHLRRIARDETVLKYNQAVDALKALTMWKENKKLRNWLTNTWLNMSKVLYMYIL